MTIRQLFNRVAQLKPHAYADAELIEWLTRLEGRIFGEIILTHDNPGLIDFEGYTTADIEDPDKHLIVPQPHDELYLWWIMSQIDLHNLEYAKYNNSAQQFNNYYVEFERFWNYNYHPLPKATHFLV